MLTMQPAIWLEVQKPFSGLGKPYTVSNGVYANDKCLVSSPRLWCVVTTAGGCRGCAGTSGCSFPAGRR